MPFPGKGPVFYVEQIIVNKQEGFFNFYNGEERIKLPHNILCLKRITQEEAERLNKVWLESQLISEVDPKSVRTHLREDGREKVSYEIEGGKWQVPLYSLKIKYPDKKFQAYVCPECGKVHIGKILENVS